MKNYKNERFYAVSGSREKAKKTQELIKATNREPQENPPSMSLYDLAGMDTDGDYSITVGPVTNIGYDYRK